MVEGEGIAYINNRESEELKMTLLPVSEYGSSSELPPTALLSFLPLPGKRLFADTMEDLKKETTCAQLWHPIPQHFQGHNVDDHDPDRADQE